MHVKYVGFSWLYLDGLKDSSKAKMIGMLNGVNVENERVRKQKSPPPSPLLSFFVFDIFSSIFLLSVNAEITQPFP